VYTSSVGVHIASRAVAAIQSKLLSGSNSHSNSNASTDVHQQPAASAVASGCTTLPATVMANASTTSQLAATEAVPATQIGSPVVSASVAAVAAAQAAAAGGLGPFMCAGASPTLVMGQVAHDAAYPYLGADLQHLGGGIGNVRGGASSKNCIHPGCSKGAIGKLRLCIAHGGGKRCTVDGCNKAAQGQKPLCKAHGGGRRCTHPGCPRSARDRTDLCIAHGGGKRCVYAGCTTSARSGTIYCSLHDGVIKKQPPGVPVAFPPGAPTASVANSTSTIAPAAVLSGGAVHAAAAPNSMPAGAAGFLPGHPQHCAAATHVATVFPSAFAQPQ